MEEQRINRFAPNITVPEEKPKYDHGYTEEEVLRIKQRREEIFKRDLYAEPVTTEEFKTIIVPFCRINRTEKFILAPEKKSKVPKAPKEKKLTKKEIKLRMNNIIIAKAMGQSVSQEDEIFFKENTKEEKLI